MQKNRVLETVFTGPANGDPMGPPTEDQAPADDFVTFFSNRLQEGDFEIRLYRQRADGRSKLAYLTTYRDQIPDEEQIKNQFGGGDYLAAGRRPGSATACTKKIYIDGPEGAGMLPQAHQGGGMIQVAQAAPAAPTLKDQLGGLRDLIEAIRPLFAQAAPAPAPATYADMGGMARQVQEIMLESIKTNFREMQNFKRELLAGAAEVDPDPGEERETMPTPGQESLLQQALKLVVDYGPGFLESSGITARLGKRVIEEDPRFLELKKNNELFAQFYDMAAAHPKVGQKVLDSILKKLGMAAPGGPAAGEGA